jgi:uncharacterized glyoxalase superfamily protein PhnB
MFSEVFPILVTRDLEASLGFYRDLLGARVEYRFPEDGAAVYVGLTLGTSRLGVGWDSGAAAEEVPQRTSIWAYADDCDRAVEMLRKAGIRVTSEPEDQPWGERVARVLDPDGNVVVIGSSARPASD